MLVKPEPKWGPALHEHRVLASQIHIAHGTTMGGCIAVTDENYNGVDQSDV